MQEYSFMINGLPVHACYHVDDINGVLIPLLRSLTEKQKQLGRRLIVFMAGPPATGKSTLACFLEKLSRTQADILPLQAAGLDGFHYSNAYLLNHTLQRGGTTVTLRSIKGAPETFDSNALESLLRQSNPVFPVYDRKTHESIANALEITEKILLIEGNWLLLDKPPWTRLPCDYRIFLQPEVPERLLRRALERKIAGGFDPVQARDFVDRSDRQNITYCINHAQKADTRILIRTNGKLEVIT